MARTRLINDDGEIIGEMQDGDSILRKKSTEFLDTTMPWGKGMRFVKVCIDYIPKLSPILTGSALGTILALTPYIQYYSNMIAKNNGGRPLKNKDIEEIMGYSDKTVKVIMDELVDKRVLFRGRTGKSYQYYANPWIFTKGNRINKTLNAMFQGYPEE